MAVKNIKVAGYIVKLIYPAAFCVLYKWYKKTYQGGVEPPVMAPEAIAVSDWLLVH